MTRTSLIVNVHNTSNTFLIIFNIPEEIKFLPSKNIYLMYSMNKKGVGQEVGEKNIRRKLHDF
jgi:hypothetical protein